MSMISARSAELLTAAAAAFQDGYSPFGSDWLSAHQVTADECMWLSNYIGILLRGFVRGSEQTQQKILILGVTTEELSTQMVDAAVDRPAIMRKLRGA